MMNKFLIVDDEQDILELITHVLKKSFSCEVITAINGEEAFERSKETKFDVISIDYKMPIMNGDKLCELIRTSENKNGETPVIFVSGNIEYNSEQLSNLKNVMFISKPLILGDLIKTIKELLSLNGPHK